MSFRALRGVHSCPP